MRILIAIFITLGATSSALAAEICGNNLDDDGDDLVDEQCFSYLTTSQCPSPLACDEGMVSPSTGSLHYILPPDVSPRVPFGPGISLTRMLQSQRAPNVSAPAYRKPMGYRFSHIYMSWLDKLTAPNPDQIILHLPRGQEVLFKYTASLGSYNFYTPQAGFHFQHMREDTSTGTFELKTLTGEVMRYNSAGKLIEIHDTLATANKVIIAYDGTTGCVAYQQRARLEG